MGVKLPLALLRARARFFHTRPMPESRQEPARLEAPVRGLFASAERPASGLGLALLGLPLLAIYSFESIAGLLPIAALIALSADTGRTFRRLVLTRPSGVLLALLALWCLICSTWSADPGEALHKAAGITALFATGVLVIAAAMRVEPRRMTRLAWLLVVATALMVVVYLIEVASGGAIAKLIKDPVVPTGTPTALFASMETQVALTKIQRGVTVLVALLPLAVYMAAVCLERPGLAGVLALAGGGAILLMTNDASKIALLAGALAGVLAMAAPVTGARALGWGGGLLVLALPWLIHDGLLDVLRQTGLHLDLSANHRIAIYTYVSELIRQRPLSGYGFDAARFLSDSAPRFTDPALIGSKSLIPLHPHNGALQLWLETGATGALLAAGLLVALGEGLARLATTRAGAAARAASFAALFTVASLSFGLWQYQWLATILIVAALIVLSARFEHPHR